MSLWAWTLEPQLAAALSVFGALTGQVIAAGSVRRGFNRKVVLGLLTASGIALLATALPPLAARWLAGS